MPTHRDFWSSAGGLLLAAALLSAGCRQLGKRPGAAAAPEPAVPHHAVSPYEQAPTLVPPDPQSQDIPPMPGVSLRRGGSSTTIGGFTPPALLAPSSDLTIPSFDDDDHPMAIQPTGSEVLPWDEESTEDASLKVEESELTPDPSDPHVAIDEPVELDQSLFLFELFSDDDSPLAITSVTAPMAIETEKPSTVSSPAVMAPLAHVRPFSPVSEWPTNGVDRMMVVTPGPMAAKPPAVAQLKPRTENFDWGIAPIE